MRETTYSTKNKERKLNRANGNYKISKVTLKKKQEISIKNYLKKKRI